MSWHFSKTTTHIARIEHICCLCGTAILPGTRYQRHVGFAFEGFYVMKVHIGCEE